MGCRSGGESGIWTFHDKRNSWTAESSSGYFEFCTQRWSYWSLRSRSYRWGDQKDQPDLYCSMWLCLPCGNGSPVCDWRSDKDSGTCGTGIGIPIQKSDFRSGRSCGHCQPVRGNSRQPCGTSWGETERYPYTGNCQCGRFFHCQRSG